MPLSSELLALHEREDTYIGDPDLVGAIIATKQLHMLAGPTRIGKSSTLDRIVDVLPDSAVVGTITNRERKLGDPLNYKTLSEGMTTERIKYLITNQDLVNYAVFPTGDIYGSLPESYPAKHNFLPTMTTGIAQLENAGFETTTLTYMVMAAGAWAQQVRGQGFKGKRKQRMEEAVVSLTYAKDNIEKINFVKNRIGYLDQTVNDLIHVTLGETAGYDKEKALETLDELLAIAKGFAVQSE